jgi:hypothetical protein
MNPLNTESAVTCGLEADTPLTAEQLAQLIASARSSGDRTATSETCACAEPATPLDILVAKARQRTLATITADVRDDLPPEILARIAAIDESKIDFSDIPETPPDALWIRTGPGNLLGCLMAEARERELAGGPFDDIERLLPEMIERIAAMEDNFLDFSDMPEMAPYAVTLITGDGPSLEVLMPKARKLAFAAA